MFWDGNKERCIQTIKPYLKRAKLNSSFLKKKLEYLYRKQTIDFILDEYILKNNNENFDYIYEDKTYHRYDSFRTYRSKQAIESLLFENKALSVVIFDNVASMVNKVFICLRKNNQKEEVVLIPVIFYGECKNKLGLHSYFVRIDIEKNWTQKKDRKTMIKDISDFGILVPCPECISRKEETRYFCVTKNWYTLIFGKKLDIEMLPKGLIDNLINKVD